MLLQYFYPTLKFSISLETVLAHGDRVLLSSAKLRIAEGSIRKTRSLIVKLKRIELTINHCVS